MVKRFIRVLVSGVLVTSLLPTSAFAMGSSTPQGEEGGQSAHAGIEVGDEVASDDLVFEDLDVSDEWEMIADEEELTDSDGELLDDEMLMVDEEGDEETLLAEEEEETPLANSWRFIDGQPIPSDKVSTENSGATLAATDYDSKGNPMYDNFSTFSRGNCSGIGAGRGIDVSSYQGKIDWKKVSNAGIDFAILRCGTGYENGTIDGYFAENVRGCRNNGIPFGVYFYSYAKSKATAEKEAEFVLKIMNDNGISYSTLTLPVYLDWEDNSLLNNRTNGWYDTANAFANKLKDQRFSYGIYASKSWWDNQLNDSRFNTWNRWVAQYNTSGLTATFRETKDVWQFTCKGRVNGISGEVDLNYSYIPSVIHMDTATYGMVFDWKAYNQYNGAGNHFPTERDAYSYFINTGLKNGERGSLIFDPVFYRNRYSDLNKAYGDNWPKYYEHFTKYGAKEGRKGSAEFDLVSYYNANPDLRAVFGMDTYKLYNHYATYGKNEPSRVYSDCPTIVGQISKYKGKDYSPVFDLGTYLQYGDIKKAFTKKLGQVGNVIDDAAVLQHFVSFGMKEGRNSSPNFDYVSYYNKYPDLRAAFGLNPTSYYMHYIDHGRKEGRVATGVSSLVGNNAKYKGKDYSAVYDSTWYANHNSDLKRAFTKKFGRTSVVDEAALINHFITFGMKEGRNSSSAFSLSAYKNRYSDLRQAFGNNNAAYYMHYVNYGKKENRRAI